MCSRNDYCRILFRYLDPLRDRFSDDCSRLFIGRTSAQYEDEVIPMEAWARPLWGLAPFWAGGGCDAQFEEIYRCGLIAGTNPYAPSYWGTCRDHDQRFIEMEAIVYALHLVPHVLWDPLGAKDRNHVIAWLDQVNAHTTPDSNWRFMRVLVNLLKRRLGYPADVAMIAEDLGRLAQFYVGGGWYSDGPRRLGVLDYYNSFSTHFDALLCLALGAGELRDPACTAFARSVEERVRLFASECALLFADDGQGVPYGRSLTYRFAQSAVFSLAAAMRMDLGSALPPSVQKGIAGRNIRWFKPERICDGSGVQSIGYAYPNLHMAENYNAPGSPYWSLKSFAFLSLPEDDGFWSLEEEDIPSAADGSIRAVGAGDMLVQRGDGDVVLYPCGARPEHPMSQAPAKYSKFAYSTRFGFSVARSQRSLEEAAPDSMLAFVVGADKTHSGVVLVRDGVASYELSAGGCAMRSCWSPWPGIEVETEIEPLPDGSGHVRHHRIYSSTACEAYDCGFAVPGDYHERTLADVERVCRVRAIGPTPGEPVLIKPEANTNIIRGKTLIPAVRYRIVLGQSEVVTAVHAC